MLLYVHVETAQCMHVFSELWTYVFYAAWGTRGESRTCRVSSGLTQFVAETRACDITCPPNTTGASKFKERFLDRYRLRSSCSTSRADEISLGSASFLSAVSGIGNREGNGRERGVVIEC